MMKGDNNLADVYRFKVFYKDGSIECGDEFNKSQVKQLEINGDCPKITLVIDEDKELIFYKRVIKQLYSDILVNIIYFLGYRRKGQTFLLSLNSLTREIRIEDDRLRKNNPTN